MAEPDDGAVAIVGMAAVFPGAADLDSFWRNLEGGVDAIAEVPPARWDPVYFDPDATDRVDRFYCRRGGFVDDVAGFDPVAFGIMPVAAAGAEPDQLLALHVAARALDDAAAGGGRAPPVERDRRHPRPRRLPQRRRSPGWRTGSAWPSRW